VAAGILVKVRVIYQFERCETFRYCGAISALPEAFFFGYSGVIFERLRISFY